MPHFLHWAKQEKNKQNKIGARCGKHTDERMEDIKDGSANNLLISDWLDESFELS